MTKHNIFEKVRDAYFINPKAPDSTAMIEAASTLIGKVIGRQFPHDDPEILPLVEPDFSTEPKSISDVANALADEYKLARNFDHQSVAQIHPSDNIVGILAQLASTIKNNNTVMPVASPVETLYENHSVNWLLENIASYKPDISSGALVLGGTSANLTGLLVARELLSKNSEKGWHGEEEAVLFTSNMSHYSVTKAADMLAPRRYPKDGSEDKPRGIIKVEMVPLTPDSYHMDPSELKKRIEAAKKRGQPIVGVVVLAGETHTGLVDDLDSIIEITQKEGVYTHVDGAYGSPYRLSRVGKLFDSVKESNSLACDPHKYMYVPYSCGAILFADSAHQAILQGFNERANDYLPGFNLQADRNEVEAAALGDKRIEGSVGGQSAAALYATIRYLGKEGIASLLNHTLDMAQLFADRIRGSDAGLRLAFVPQLNTVCVEPVDGVTDISELDKRVEHTCARLEEDYGIYLTSTKLPYDRKDPGKKRQVFRFVATHPHTDEDDVRHIADNLIETWKEVNNL